MTTPPAFAAPGVKVAPPSLDQPRRKPRFSRPCLHGCAAPARLFISGWRCAEHAPATQPTPPEGTTAADLLEQAHVRHLEEAAAAKVAAATRAADLRARRALAP